MATFDDEDGWIRSLIKHDGKIATTRTKVSNPVQGLEVGHINEWMTGWERVDPPRYRDNKDGEWYKAGLNDRPWPVGLSTHPGDVAYAVLQGIWPSDCLPSRYDGLPLIQLDEKRAARIVAACGLDPRQPLPLPDERHFPCQSPGFC